MTMWRFLRKLGNNLPQDPVIPLLGIYPKDSQFPIYILDIFSIYPKDMCSTMFIAELFVIARTWKQLKYPSTEE